jgi:integrase
MASFEQSGKKKLWSVRFRIIENGQIVNKRLSGFKTKKEANSAYLDFLKEYDEEKARIVEPETKDIRFCDLYEKYHDHAKSNLKDSSVRDLESCANGKLLPVFGDKSVKDIKPIEIVEWQNSLSYSFKYKMKLRYFLQQIFGFGEKYYELPNPMDKVDPPKNKELKKEMEIWSYEEFLKFKEAIKEDETYALFFEALYITGCRRSEMIAIGRNDIDEKTNYLSITKSITTKSEDEPWKITTPKSQSSVRKIYIPHDLAVNLVSEWEKEKGQFVFGGDTPIKATSLDRRMRKYAEIAGVKRIRIHDLRHSCASYLISKGVSILAVSKRLGHATTQQTLNTYSHLMPSDQQFLESVLNKMEI